MRNRSGENLDDEPVLVGEPQRPIAGVRRRAGWGRTQVWARRANPTVASHSAGFVAKAGVMRVRQASRSRSTPVRRPLWTVSGCPAPAPIVARTAIRVSRRPRRCVTAVVRATPGVRCRIDPS